MEQFFQVLEEHPGTAFCVVLALLWIIRAIRGEEYE